MTSYFKGGKDNANIELKLSQRERKPKPTAHMRRKKEEKTRSSLEIIEEGVEKATVLKLELSTERIGFQDEEASNCYGQKKMDETSGYVVSSPSRSEED